MPRRRPSQLSRGRGPAVPRRPQGQYPLPLWPSVGPRSNRAISWRAGPAKPAVPSPAGCHGSTVRSAASSGHHCASSPLVRTRPEPVPSPQGLRALACEMARPLSLARGGPTGCWRALNLTCGVLTERLRRWRRSHRRQAGLCESRARPILAGVRRWVKLAGQSQAQSEPVVRQLGGPLVGTDAPVQQLAVSSTSRRQDGSHVDERTFEGRGVSSSQGRWRVTSRT